MEVTRFPAFETMEFLNSQIQLDSTVQTVRCVHDLEHDSPSLLSGLLASTLVLSNPFPTSSVEVKMRLQNVRSSALQNGHSYLHINAICPQFIRPRQYPSWVAMASKSSSHALQMYGSRCDRRIHKIYAAWDLINVQNMRFQVARSIRESCSAHKVSV